MRGTNEASENNKEEVLEVSDERINLSTRAQIATWASLIANICLLSSNLTIFFMTNALSLLSTAADSFLDLVSQLIIFLAMRGNTNVNKELWPLGKSRLEPVGLVVVSSLMGITAFQVFGESIYRLFTGIFSEKEPVAPKLELPTIILVSSAIVIKTILYFVCYRLGKTSSSMAVLAEDHRNDVLSNLVALLAGLISTFVPSAWFADPIGAMLISIYIFIRWVGVGKEHAITLIGKAASPAFLKQIEDVAASHEESMQVDVVRAYHFGQRFFVEVEVVVPPDVSIVFAHDQSLILQKKIEALEEVERAHVHVDYNFRDEDEHKQTFVSTPNSKQLHRRHGYNHVDNENSRMEHEIERI